VRTATLEQPIGRCKIRSAELPEKSATGTREPFAALPHALRKDPRLKGHDKAILLAAALLEYARAGASCFPSNRRLADDLGCAPRTVQLALAALKRTGWVRVELGADTPTGRRIVLVWREADCAPSPPPVARPGAQPVAPEGRMRENEERPGVGSGFVSPPPPAGEPAEPDLATLHQWAEGSDPILRRIARARLAELDQGAGAVAVPPPVPPLVPVVAPRPEPQVHAPAASPRPVRVGPLRPGPRLPIPAIPPSQRHQGLGHVLEPLAGPEPAPVLPVWITRSP
jgi:hypothetical protein